MHTYTYTYICTHALSHHTHIILSSYSLLLLGHMHHWRLVKRRQRKHEHATVWDTERSRRGGRSMKNAMQLADPHAESWALAKSLKYRQAYWSPISSLSFPAPVSGGCLYANSLRILSSTDAPGAVNPAGSPCPLTTCLSHFYHPASSQYLCFFTLLYEIHAEPKPVTWSLS